MAQFQLDEGPGSGTVRSTSPVTPIVGAVVGALVGAGLWAAIVALTGYEVGYVAWAVGGIVGFCTVAAGGKGGNLAVIAAVLALAAIFGGKLWGTQMALGSELDKVVDLMCNQATYDEFILDSQSLPEGRDDDSVRTYMLERSFADAPSPEEVPDDELASFREHHLPDLESAAANPPSLSQWKENERRQMGEFAGEISLVDAVVEELGLLDIVFGLLGVATAFKMVAGAGGNAPRPRRPLRTRSGTGPGMRDEDGPPPV